MKNCLYLHRMTSLFIFFSCPVSFDSSQSICTNLTIKNRFFHIKIGKMKRAICSLLMKRIISPLATLNEIKRKLVDMEKTIASNVLFVQMLYREKWYYWRQFSIRCRMFHDYLFVIKFNERPQTCFMSLSFSRLAFFVLTSSLPGCNDFQCTNRMDNKKNRWKPMPSAYRIINRHPI